ncbi:MAG: aldehyde dehydrogenase family protein [Alphaproteobacteria bacterium]|mgnify:CR=1 FL=1|jgi:aldehyde dehydrogenase (NAD+)
MFLRVADIVNRLKLDTDYISSGNCVDYSPVNGKEIASFPFHDSEYVKTVVERSQKAFGEWKEVAPRFRSELIRLFGEELRANTDDLAQLIVIETGKIYADALIEVQKSIAVCEYASGLPQRLSSISAPTESTNLSILETWLPIGPVAVVSSFNFPLRVWVLNAMLAIACGDSVVWRPSRKAMLTAFAANTLLRRAMARTRADCPEYLTQFVTCGHDEAAVLAGSPDIALLCATGSPVMARNLVAKVGMRLGRSLLSLGGNNAAIVTPSADIPLAVEHLIRSTVVDGGQRCTSLQRLFCHSSVYAEVVGRLKDGLQRIYVNSPFERRSEISPLIDREAHDSMRLSLDQAQIEGGVVSGGERLMIGNYDNAYYVHPALVEMPSQTPTVRTELLAPVLFVMSYDHLDDAVARINEVPQTLISCIFSNSVQETGYFSSLDGVMSGVATVNAGSVGYDLVAIFSGERNSGGSGSEPWRSYMRSKTCLVNYNF